MGPVAPHPRALPIPPCLRGPWSPRSPPSPRRGRDAAPRPLQTRIGCTVHVPRLKTVLFDVDDTLVLDDCSSPAARAGTMPFKAMIAAGLDRARGRGPSTSSSEVHGYEFSSNYESPLRPAAAAGCVRRTSCTGQEPGPDRRSRGGRLPRHEIPRARAPFERRAPAAASLSCASCGDPDCGVVTHGLDDQAIGKARCAMEPGPLPRSPALDLHLGPDRDLEAQSQALQQGAG